MYNINKSNPPQTQFYTLIDANLRLRPWNNHTVSRQKQQSLVGQSIETSLPRSQASNLLDWSCEGKTFYHNTCSWWYSRLHLRQHNGTLLPLWINPRYRAISFSCPSAHQMQPCEVFVLFHTFSLFLSCNSRWAFSHLCQDASSTADNSRKGETAGGNSRGEKQQGRCEESIKD